MKQLDTIYRAVYQDLGLQARLLESPLALCALGVAASALAVYVLTRRALDANVRTPRLAPPLSLAAALLATLAPVWQIEVPPLAGPPWRPHCRCVP